MKKYVIKITCTLLSVLLLCGCSSAGKSAAPDSTAPQEQVQEASTPSPAANEAAESVGAKADAAGAPLDPAADYLAVMNGSALFHSVDSGADMTIGEIGSLVSSDESVSARAFIPCYAILDLDGNGTDEAVLQIDIGESDTWGYLILHHEGATVNGYSVWMRALIDLKESGLFWASSGSTGGIARLNFDGGTLNTETLIYSELNYDAAGQPVVTYYAYGAQISEAEYQSLNAEFDASTNVSWIESTNNLSSSVEIRCSDNLMGALYGVKEIIFQSYLYSQSGDESQTCYVSTGELGRCYINNLEDALNPSSRHVPVNEYAEVDLDGDDSLELILRVDNLPGACSYGYVILRDAGDSVNGYLFYKNGMDCFKQDGTFIMPGNSYCAVAGISFAENGYTLTVFADIDYYADGEEPHCTIGGATAAYPDAQEYMNRQNEKHDVVWTVFEARNYEGILDGTEEIYLSGSADSAAINEISMLVGGVIEPRYCAVTKYCIADIDGDGEDELILWVSSAEEELYCTLIVKYNTGVERYCADVYMGDAMFRQIDSGSLQEGKNGLIWVNYITPNASEFGFDRLRSDGRFEYEILGNEELTIRRYIGSESDVTIPAEVNGLKVSSISYYTVDSENFGAFQSCDSIKSITIPDGVELIYDDAFRDCTALESISIPASVRGIGNCAFSNCGQLAAVYFEGDPPSLGNYVFESCPSVTLYYHVDTDG